MAVPGEQRFTGRCQRRGKGLFSGPGNKTWSSHWARMVFKLKLTLPPDELYDPDEHQHLIDVKNGYRFGQKPKGDAKGPYVKPFFKKEELDKMRAHVIGLFEKIIREKQSRLRVRVVSDGDADMLVAVSSKEYGDAEAQHQTSLCEMCMRSRVPCTGYVEVLDGQYYRVKDRKKFAARSKKLGKLKVKCCEGNVVPPGCLKLYHQTAHDAADSILSSKEMLRGHAGMYGAAIYFATSAEATEGKALHRGVILECIVYLGAIKEVMRPDGSITFGSLTKEGFNSVRGRNNPSDPRLDEYMVYNKDQVLNIRRYQPEPQ